MDLRVPGSGMTGGRGRLLAEYNTRMVPIRWVAGTLVLLTAVFSRDTLGANLPTFGLYLLGVLVLFLNVAVIIAQGRLAGLYKRFPSIQILVDGSMILALVFSSGGVWSPWVFAFLIYLYWVTLIFRGGRPLFVALLGIAIPAMVLLLEGQGYLPRYDFFLGLPLGIRANLSVNTGLLVFEVLAALTVLYVGTSTAAAIKHLNALQDNLSPNAANLEVEALREEEQKRAQFVRLVTHELRTPVTGAQSLLRTLLRGLAGEFSEQQRAILERIGDRLDRLNLLINDLLDLAASRTLDSDRPLEAILLEPSLRRVIERLRHEADNKQITVALETSRSDMTVRATEDGLDKVFGNLLDNALKYTPPGGLVQIGIGVRMGMAVVTVSDTGMGIPEEDIPHIWDEFYRGSNARHSEIIGTGLGLCLVKQFVDSYGGLIEVNSREGVGTTFTVRLLLFE